MSEVESLLEGLMRLDRPLLVALDVDGTVSPIVRDPDRAEIPTRTLQILRALAEAPGIVLALVTGRDLSSLRRMEQLEGIWRAVEHGGVVLAPGEAPGRRDLTSSQREALEKFRDWADAHAHGAFIEHKPQAVAVHVRAIAVDYPSRADRLMDEAGAVSYTHLRAHET